MITSAALEAAAEVVYSAMPPTPQYAWPLLAERTGCEVWVKHENHTPIGAFKVRGGLVYMDRLRRAHPDVSGVVTATRGNHGQSIAFAARRHGLRSVIFVPRGNSVEKNSAMRAFGAELIEHGRDFDEAREEAERVAEERGLWRLPSFDEHLVLGVATYGRELLTAVSDLHTVYAPIGLGSGISGLVGVRDLLGLATRIVGVVMEQLPAYALSFEAGEVVTSAPADTIADGMAVRVPHAHALEIIRAGVERIVRVTDQEVAAAIQAYHTDTHNLAEGAGAAPLAALLQEKDAMRGRRVGVVLTGGNIDMAVVREIFSRPNAGL